MSHASDLPELGERRAVGFGPCERRDGAATAKPAHIQVTGTAAADMRSSWTGDIDGAAGRVAEATSCGVCYKGRLSNYAVSNTNLLIHYVR